MHEHEKERPNRESDMEPAEGSRETVNEEIAGNQRGRGTETMRREDREPRGASDLPEESFGQQPEHGGGISNRPLEEEQDRQENLPPRGERRENWKED